MEKTFYIKGLFHWYVLQDQPMIILPQKGWDFLQPAIAGLRTDWGNYMGTMVIEQGIGKELATLQAYGQLLKTTKL